MKRIRLPGPATGLSIGLFGGSFNPAHEGHQLVAKTALARLHLDAVWWLVARGNPMKSDHGDPAARLRSAEALTVGFRMRVSDVESRMGLTYSADTIRALRRAAPHTRFVWLMGADNVSRFHMWKDWKTIARCVPIAIIARPGVRISKATVFARQFARARLPERDAASLATRTAPAWIYLRARENSASSTRLRAQA